MKVTRRRFFATGLVVGMAGLVGFLAIRLGGNVEALETDPDADNFLYRDGWIERAN